jgi:hypothetical protein
VQLKYEDEGKMKWCNTVPFEYVQKSLDGFLLTVTARTATMVHLNSTLN